MRVLIVDNDENDAQKLKINLKKLNYEVAVCNLANEAIDMLREKNERFKVDIVMIDVSIGDMAGFKFINHVSLNFDVPVIMMSRNEETSKVMIGLECGACDFLLKPIKMKKLRYIWQHVEKRMQQHQIEGKIAFESNGGVSSRSIKKRKLVWIDELELKFKKAVDDIGIEEATAKKIHKSMDDPSVTVSQVASHLQKFKEKRKSAAVLLPIVSTYSGHPSNQRFDFQKEQNVERNVNSASSSYPSGFSAYENASPAYVLQIFGSDFPSLLKECGCEDLLKLMQ